MNERFHTSPTDKVIPRGTPSAFMAGPVQGALDWQLQAGSEILQRRDDMVVVSPRRDEENMVGFDYGEQVAWEKAHLRQAAWHGSIAFWFEPQDPSVEHKPGRAYAQTTRIEIGRVVGWIDGGLELPLIVGIHPEYKGRSDKYVRSLCGEIGLPVLTTLEDVIDTVVEETPQGRPKVAAKVLSLVSRSVQRGLGQLRSA